MKQSKVYIYGKHALIEALLHRPEAVKKVFLSPSLDDDRLRELVKKSGITAAVLESKNIRDMGGSASHQGVVAAVSLDDLMIPFKEFIRGMRPDGDSALVLLAEVQDPHNVGAVIRSAAAFGMSGVLIPEHNQAPVTGAVVKVSAGMAFRVPLVSIGNINQTVRELKDAGFMIYGLAGEKGAKDLPTESFTEPSVFILGNEGSGIREKTREYCDTLLSIPIHPKCESLNAAASASIALYAWSTHHPEALRKK